MSSTQQLLLGEGAGGSIPVYIEDVFSAWLYTGSNADSTVVQNGIDLSTKGGLVWLKGRSGSFSVDRHELTDTVRGVNKYISSNTALAQNNFGALNSFNADGFTLGAAQRLSFGGGYYVSWTFREQRKFFDIVTWTGNGASGRSIDHNLGAQPAWILIKRTDTDADWAVTANTGTGAGEFYFNLNASTAGTQGTTGPAANGYALIGGGSDETFFNIYSGASGNSAVNASGGTYVAYVFASNAGGFGLTGADNVITCGYLTAGATVNLGYEPQFVMMKQTNGTQPWEIIDSSRGFFAPPSTITKYLVPNTNSDEQSWGGVFAPTSTGFKDGHGSGNYVYMAIRKGPMKPPTTGTSVLNISQWPGTFGGGVQYTGFPVDSLWANLLSGDSWNTEVFDRLRQISTVPPTSLSGGLLSTAQTTAESANSSTQGWYNDRFYQSVGSGTIYYAFRRAPSFFDEVCYTGNGSDLYINHNLGVFPQLIITKSRSATANWTVTFANDSSFSQQFLLGLNVTDASFANIGGQVIPVSSTQIRALDAFGSVTASNANGVTYISYLFATCAGVSKVGSYTGTGALQTINCGFTSGARWVMIKRTDSTGAWYVWDSSRGITASDDPYIRLNSTAAEVTNTNYVDTDSTGFKVTAAAPSEINASGGIYLFMAIA